MVKPENYILFGLKSVPGRDIGTGRQTDRQTE